MCFLSVPKRHIKAVLRKHREMISDCNGISGGGGFDYSFGNSELTYFVPCPTLPTVQLVLDVACSCSHQKSSYRGMASSVLPNV